MIKKKEVREKERKQQQKYGVNLLSENFPTQRKYNISPASEYPVLALRCSAHRGSKRIQTSFSLGIQRNFRPRISNWHLKNFFITNRRERNFSPYHPFYINFKNSVWILCIHYPAVKSSHAREYRIPLVKRSSPADSSLCQFVEVFWLIIVWFRNEK